MWLAILTNFCRSDTRVGYLSQTVWGGGDKMRFANLIPTLGFYLFVKNRLCWVRPKQGIGLSENNFFYNDLQLQVRKPEGPP